MAGRGFGSRRRDQLGTNGSEEKEGENFLPGVLLCSLSP